jgi:hypothetical protein
MSRVESAGYICSICGWCSDPPIHYLLYGRDRYLVQCQLEDFGIVELGSAGYYFLTKSIIALLAFAIVIVLTIINDTRARLAS